MLALCVIISIFSHFTRDITQPNSLCDIQRVSQLRLINQDVRLWRGIINSAKRDSRPNYICIGAWSAKDECPRQKSNLIQLSPTMFVFFLRNFTAIGPISHASMDGLLWLVFLSEQISFAAIDLSSFCRESQKDTYWKRTIEHLSVLNFISKTH